MSLSYTRSAYSKDESIDSYGKFLYITLKIKVL